MANATDPSLTPAVMSLVTSNVPILADELACLIADIDCGNTPAPSGSTPLIDGSDCSVAVIWAIPAAESAGSMRTVCTGPPNASVAEEQRSSTALMTWVMFTHSIDDAPASFMAVPAAAPATLSC